MVGAEGGELVGLGGGAADGEEEAGLGVSLAHALELGEAVVVRDAASHFNRTLEMGGGKCNWRDPLAWSDAKA